MNTVDLLSLGERPNTIRRSLPVPFSRSRRFFASALFVAAWMALGFLFHLDTNTYLLVGVPLTILFQLLVKREALTALWLRTAPRLEMTGRFFALTAALLVWPACSIVQILKLHSGAPYVIWMVCCLIGTVGAGYSLQKFDRIALRSLLICLVTGGALAIGILYSAALVRHLSIPADALLSGARWFLLYFPVCFVIEEVTFRGAIDSCVQRAGERHPWLSALFVSSLWGLWHLPMLPHPSLGIAITLVIYQSLLGIPLSFAWRRSGNLAVPCAVHAIVDAVRNAIGLMG